MRLLEGFGVCCAGRQNGAARRRTVRPSRKVRRIAHGAPDDRVEDRLHVGRRAADHAQDLARRRQVAVPSLQLVEQPHVLDGDHRLIGEGLEERDLVVGESAGVAAGHRDPPNRIVVPEQRHHNNASPTTDTSGAATASGSRDRCGIGDIERRAIANGLGVYPPGVERPWEERPQGGVASIAGARECGELDLIARDPGQRAVYPPSSRTALATIASNTGWTSVGERLMTRRMSLVAVC